MNFKKIVNGMLGFGVVVRRLAGEEHDPELEQKRQRKQIMEHHVRAQTQRTNNVNSWIAQVTVIFILTYFVIFS